MPKAFSGIDACKAQPVLAERGLVARPAMHSDNLNTALAMVAGTALWTLRPDYVLPWLNLPAGAMRAAASRKLPYAVSFVTMRRKPRLALMDALQRRLRKRAGRRGQHVKVCAGALALLWQFCCVPQLLRCPLLHLRCVLMCQSVHSARLLATMAQKGRLEFGALATNCQSSASERDERRLVCVLCMSTPVTRVQRPTRPRRCS
jgi:hypothetical protein